MKCIDGIYQLNYILCGNSSIGKTTLCNRYISGTFTNQSQITIGVDYQYKRFDAKGKQVKLHIFDTGGQEKYKAITTSYYRGADGVFLCFSLNDMKSFVDMYEHLCLIKNHVGPNAHVLLVGTIKDDISRRIVDEQKIKEFAEKHSLEYIEVSSLTGENVDKCFGIMHEKVLKDIDDGLTPITNMSYIDGDNKHKGDFANRSCCCIL